MLRVVALVLLTVLMLATGKYPKLDTSTDIVNVACSMAGSSMMPCVWPQNPAQEAFASPQLLFKHT